jgi:phosphatidylglycerophosphate synthase
MPGPTLNEVRAKGQPPEVLARLNDEHWFGRLYMRKLSPYATVVFARLGWSPNAVTVCFMLAGVAAGVLTAVPGLAAAIGVALLIQLYLLFDCSDGELARYTGRFSATGVYLDRMGHYIAEALLLAGLGVRAQGHFSLSGGYVSAGLAAAICATLIKAETDTVIVARSSSGLGSKHDDEALAPRSQGLALARRLASALRVHRIIQAVELSVLILLAAMVLLFSLRLRTQAGQEIGQVRDGVAGPFAHQADLDPVSAAEVFTVIAKQIARFLNQRTDLD